ncbi:hypothetical protein CONCODRAFT_72894 [Conidiobolus coronatus NRRL 28638]|uniref:Retrotransposon gag domain-containing protein n=1 Tax=Conidiobolus coronatus (strain ATCC 28846 / CBS 209.66 / NRRL 28638) TaxID=796925 RepID=A0A137NXG9_CONC2|nr:hypothetical protein CONCODRAFT_72894 [Conidiobolus coronatus NRRL 28638]|eukprot:KXN67543.1 hypothetical protein CONCODRAFT_72894 [Conidiobolus coronatus NRRL 28638]
MEISENALKIQQIISEYVSRSISNPTLLEFDNSRPVESNVLPSYQNAIDDQDLIGTSDSNLNQHTQKDENSSETDEHANEQGSNNSFPEFKLKYCFSGSSKIQARDFISDYNFLAFRNKWSPEEKMEFFPNHLENDALNWYLSIQDHLTSWKIVKMEFMEKYLAN